MLHRPARCVSLLTMPRGQPSCSLCLHFLSMALGLTLWEPSLRPWESSPELSSASYAEGRQVDRSRCIGSAQGNR